MHLEESAQKAFAVLRMIRRTFSRITRTEFQILYGAYVRPLLEYANPVVYSGRTKDVILIERVQRAATKMVAGLKSMDYETRLVAWPTGFSPLTQQTHSGDMVRRFLSSERSPSLGKLFLVLVQNTISHLFTQVLALAHILPRAENLRSSATPFFHLCLSGERQLLNDKNKTDPENLGESLDPVYHSVNPFAEFGQSLVTPQLLTFESGLTTLLSRTFENSSSHNSPPVSSKPQEDVRGIQHYCTTRARWPKWLEREFTDQKVRGSNPTSASRLPLSRLGQPGSIPALVLPSGSMAVGHRKGATAERTTRLIQKKSELKSSTASTRSWSRSIIPSDVKKIKINHSAVAPFWCLTAMLPEGSTRAGILPGCPSLDRGSREAEVGFELWTFRS
ncbi:hypothetical protein CSKR_112663, partial [Clonorchis sinensis]